MKFGFLFDQSRCMGCNACTVACKDWNKVGAGPVRWRTHKLHEITTATPNEFKNLVMSCNHCEDPACVKSCGSGAIAKDERTGIVQINRDKCVNVRACITACPFGAIGVADSAQETETKSSWLTPHPAQKCNMCIDRVNDGQVPVCVAACPARAIQWGITEKLESIPGAVRMNQSDFGYAYKNNTETGPSLWIKKRGDLNIVKKVN